MLDDVQDARVLDEEEEIIRMFDDNEDFLERLAASIIVGSLQEVAPPAGATKDYDIRTDTAFLHAIASHLPPLTLLHLSRTSKGFRKILMSKASRWVWRRALCTVPGLPACPVDLNPALYTALIFACCCFGCGAPDAFSVDYALRLRLCESCWKANVTEGARPLQQVPLVVREFLLMLIPSANTFNFKDIKRSLTRVNPVTHIEQDSYYGPELQALTAFFWPNLPAVEELTELKTAFLDRAEYVLTRQMHAIELYAWERVLGADRFVSRTSIRATIEDRDYIYNAFDLGWHMDPDWWWVPRDEDFDHIPGPGWGTIKQGCTLNKHPPKSRAQIAQEQLARSEREAAAYQARVSARYTELAEWYAFILESNHVDTIDADEMPNAYDGARLFDAELATKNDARALITTSAIEASQADILARAHAYTFDVRFALSALLPPPRARKTKGKRVKPWWERPSGSVGSMLARPTALFACDVGGCGECSLGWPEINWHWRDAHDDESVWRRAPDAFQGRRIRAKVWDEGVLLAGRILDAVGLRRDTETGRLDGMCEEGRLYCACGDPELAGPDALSWVSLVRHVHRHLKMDECKKADNAVLWINDHRDLETCIKLLPKGSDTSPASARVRADPYTTARINALLTVQPEGLTPMCSFCVATTDTKKAAARDTGRCLTPRADAIPLWLAAAATTFFNPAMFNNDQEIQPLDENAIKIFEDNVKFQEMLEDLQEIVPDRPSYDPNRVGIAFHRAIRRQPLNVPLPPIDVRPVSNSGTGRQTKIVKYFLWSQKIPDLPMEVILEIASHLAPLTLLHFSRTSKLFRRTLMNKASRWIWQGALRTVLGLPPCPVDLNEALYTALVFDCYCFGCGMPDAYSIDYALRLRLCQSCWNANISVGFSLNLHMDPNWDDIPEDEDFDYIPDPSADTITQGVALNSDPPKSKAQIAKEHGSRAVRESATYNALLETRYGELTEWYELILDDNDYNIRRNELPTSYDGARLFSALATRNDARASFDHATVGEYSAGVLTCAHRYLFDVRCALVDLLPPFCGPRPVEDRGSFIEEMLVHPTALFLCSFSKCRGDSGYQWDQLTDHWRDVHAHESVWRTPGPQLFGGGVSQNRSRKIRAKFWDKGAELVDRILDVAGLARVTTMNELDDLCLEGRLYCACGDPDLFIPEDDLCWSLLVCHIHDHLEMDKCRRPRSGLPWINDHRDLYSCIKLLPEGADTSAASVRVVADQHTSAHIRSFYKACPDGARLVCALCAAMIDDPRKAAKSGIGPFLDPWMTPMGSYIVYHMQAK
ncbi:hypothetical protein V8D89_006227 [Ganoderma adspersum]